MPEFTQVAFAQPALPYAQTIVTLNAGQAAGTSPVLAANANRRGLKIQPAASAALSLTSGATAGMAVFANVPNSFTGPECPTGALYVVGLALNAVVVIWEA